jgi:hypothetical protein
MLQTEAYKITPGSPALHVLCLLLCCAVLCADEIGVQIEKPFGILPLEDCTDTSSYTVPTLHVVLCCAVRR